MKNFVIGGTAAMLCAGLSACNGQLFTPANVYAAPAAQIYQILDAMKIDHGGPMGTLEIAKHGETGKSITWSGSGAHAMVDCTATLTALDAQRTKVDTECGGGSASDGAAAGAATDIVRIAMVEQIDSTLRGRPYDKHKVEMASAGAVMKNLPQMEVNALKMQHDIQKDVNAANAEQAQRHEEAMAAPMSQPVVPGQPLDPKGMDPTPTSPVN